MNRADIINQLEKLPEALVEKAYMLDVVGKYLKMQYSQTFEIVNHDQFDYEINGFRYYDYSGWRIEMESKNEEV